MTLNQIFEMEKAVQLALKSFKTEVIASVANAKMPGVTIPKNTNGLKIAYVPLNVIKENKFSLSAETYIQQAQADLVDRAIAPLPTALQTCEMLKTLIDKKSIVRSEGGQKYTVALNTSTISALEKALSSAKVEVA